MNEWLMDWMMIEWWMDNDNEEWMNEWYGME